MFVNPTDWPSECFWRWRNSQSQNWLKWIFTQNCHWKSITASPWQLLVVLPILSVNPPFPAIKPTYLDLTPPLFAWASCSIFLWERIQTPRTSPPTRLVHDGRERGEPCTWATQRPFGDSSRGEQNRALGRTHSLRLRTWGFWAALWHLLVDTHRQRDMYVYKYIKLYFRNWIS